MRRGVCIVGVGVVESPDPLVELSHKELLFHATRRALDDAGLQRKDIEGAVTAACDLLEGRSLANQYSLDSIGGVMKPCDLRLCEDGMYGLFAACMEIMAGQSQVVIAACVHKCSERDAGGRGCPGLVAESMEPVFARPVCNSVPNPLALGDVLAAMEARVFMERTGLGEKDLAAVAVKNLGNAGRATTEGGVMASEIVSWPIRQATRARGADAACALVLASEERATRAPRRPVFVRGVGWCSDRSHFASREQGVARETRWAAQQAYEMAGIRRPSEEIDVAEVSDWYAHRELMHCQALGLCPRGDAIGRCIGEGTFARAGKLPVNASGGLLGRGNAVGASGLVRVAQVAEQIRGDAGRFRLPGVEVGLAQSWSGMPAASAGVAVLSRW